MMIWMKNARLPERVSVISMEQLDRRLLYQARNGQDYVGDYLATRLHALPDIAVVPEYQTRKYIQTSTHGEYPNIWKIEIVTPVPKIHPPASEGDLRKIACTFNF